MNYSDLPIWDEFPFIIPSGFEVRKGDAEGLGEIVSISKGNIHCDIGAKHLKSQQDIDAMLHNIRGAEFESKHPKMFFRFIEDEALMVEGKLTREEFDHRYLPMKADLLEAGLGTRTLVQ